MWSPRSWRGIGSAGLVNPGGWPQLRAFAAAAARPETAPSFLALTGRAALTTIAYAVLGTVLAMTIGVVGGVLVAETWWPRRPGDTRPRTGWYVTRVVLAVPRGVHEAVWGLLLVAVLGLDPLVAILAIGIPFGAVSAKVVADLIDDTAGDAWTTLRAAGAGRLAALCYGVMPVAGRDIVSYGFYRLECAIRSAAILGVIGAGGLGFELALSFQALRYEEMWTLIWTLVAVSGLADLWSARIRGAAGRRGQVVRWSLALGPALVVASVVHLDVSLRTLWSPETIHLARTVGADAWPPRLTGIGWSGLLRSSAVTLQMSVLAIAGATVLAVPAAFVAARGDAGVRRIASLAARGLLLLTRAIPPPVWAFVLLLVLFPGVLPGAAALAVYNLGILGRLMAEVVENLERRPADALRALGARSPHVFVYGILPQAGARFSAYALYRWEVALRETVIVGVVGAAGLGRRLGERLAAFDHGAVLTVVLALIALSILVDVLSAGFRRSLR